MKTKLIQEIKAEDENQLLKRLAKEKKELADLYLNLKIKKLKDTRSIFHKRKNISRILTILNEKRKKI